MKIQSEAVPGKSIAVEKAVKAEIVSQNMYYWAGEELSALLEKANIARCLI